MKKAFTVTLLAMTVSACVQTSDDEILRQIYAIGPDSPQTEIVSKRFAPISPKKVAVHFGFPSECENRVDLGLLYGWGDKNQPNDEIIADFQKRAAKYGANIVSYEVGISSLDEMTEVLHRKTTYSLWRCR